MNKQRFFESKRAEKDLAKVNQINWSYCQYQTNFKTKILTRDKEDIFIMIEVPVHQKDMTYKYRCT